MAEIVAAARAARPVAEATRIVLRPPSVDGGDDFTVERDRARAGGCAATKPERWVRQTDFSNDEAVGFLADRLEPARRRGAAARARAPSEGDTVLIGHPDDAVVFDFKPGLDAGAEMLGRRGEDQRFESPGRPPTAAGRSRRRWPSAPRARPAPTSPAGSDRRATRRAARRPTRSARPTTPTWPEDDPEASD